VHPQPPLPYAAAHAELLACLDTPGWERTLTLGRLHGLVGRWHAQLEEAGVIARVAEPIRRHLWSARLLADDRTRMARWEADRLAHAFRESDVPVIVLKGTAYILADLPPGRARILSDIDILVPHARLAEVEALLHDHGWQSLPHSDYDEHYYREWMHELPPLQHVVRGAYLDLHHNILPRTSPLCPDAAALIAAAVPIPNSPLKMLAPADMVLHSIVHGFYGGEFTNGWRDVLDVHELVTHFAQTVADFWTIFQQRATQFRFERPAYYALTAAESALGTAIPTAVKDQLKRHAPWRPLRNVMNWAIGQTVLPALPPTGFERLALRGLYLRSHWVKMPPALLARHLWTKHRQRNAFAVGVN
jgi:Uncharacterised nucleotidyltransferase